jgi:hypothetical protein
MSLRSELEYVVMAWLNEVFNCRTTFSVRFWFVLAQTLYLCIEISKPKTQAQATEPLYVAINVRTFFQLTEVKQKLACILDVECLIGHRPLKVTSGS